MFNRSEAYIQASIDLLYIVLAYPMQTNSLINVSYVSFIETKNYKLIKNLNIQGYSIVFDTHI